MTEEWKPIPGFESYEVSKRGAYRRADTKEVRSGQRHTNGYRQFSFSVNGQRKVMYAHRAVLLAFVGPCPDGKEAAHLNGDKLDNRLENLAWVTHHENILHKQGHGTQLMGERVNFARISNLQAAAAKVLLDAGWAGTGVAEVLGISAPTVYHIKSGKRWAHV